MAMSDKNLIKLITWIALLDIVLAVLLLLAVGCEPKVSREPIVVVANEAIQVSGNVPFTPPKDGYWLSNEAMIRLLERLNDQQAEIDRLKAKEGAGYKLGGQQRVDLDTHIGLGSGARSE